MPNMGHGDDARLVVHFVDDAVVADTNTPEVLGTGEPLRACRARVLIQIVNARRDPPLELGRDPSEVPRFSQSQGQGTSWSTQSWE